MRIITRGGKRHRPRGRVPTVAHAMRQRRRDVERLGRVRELVFGAQDGLLTTLGLVTGVSGATTSHYAVLTAGCAEAVAGMVAMAAGEYISSRSQAQVYRAEIEAERLEVHRDPAGELEEVGVLFETEGLSRDNARRVAELIATSEESWLKTMTEKELGLPAADATSASVGAMVIGVAFLLGAAVPILPYVLATGRGAMALSVALTLLALAAIGVGKARLARVNPLTSALEVVAIGSVAATVGYLFGTLLPHVLHVS